MQFPGENGQIIAFHVYLWSWCPLWDILNSQLKILGHTLEGLHNISNYRAKYNFRVICSALSDHHYFVRLWHHLHHFSLLQCKCENFLMKIKKWICKRHSKHFTFGFMIYLCFISNTRTCKFVLNYIIPSLLRELRNFYYQVRFLHREPFDGLYSHTSCDVGYRFHFARVVCICKPSSRKITTHTHSKYTYQPHYFTGTDNQCKWIYHVRQ